MAVLLKTMLTFSVLLKSSAQQGSLRGRNDAQAPVNDTAVLLAQNASSAATGVEESLLGLAASSCKPDPHCNMDGGQCKCCYNGGCDIEEDCRCSVGASGSEIQWSYNEDYCMSVADNNFQNGQKLQLWTCQESLGQRFTYDTYGEESGMIQVAGAPAFCVVISGDEDRNGAALQLWQCDRSNGAQYW
eukprot:CAMPEP_0197631388 /NCGR_PEP_ID=MMETSP1338-20131121/8560_1 /TAXON_ID=43686 ORGANISM="Pelagodinium beii, Strain RCC1491" /NCGR_SAMPLE_ID=MMETSP1338 /ASSEMBLY_ACC=CAM_ASM_000754 /LENGTH=187 /DNA_ID=CAMNT_0043202813 /DNA_START=53 /DNA_END=613 /DNA_ORIENTATION=-